jgi:hypothetical protein
MATLALGFLPGKEAKDAGVTNAGLYDRKCQVFDVSAMLSISPQSVKP